MSIKECVRKGYVAFYVIIDNEPVMLSSGAIEDRESLKRVAIERLKDSQTKL